MSSVGSIGSQAVDPNAMRSAMGNANVTRQQKIEQAGVQFEAIMVRQFLNDALKPSIKGSIEEEGAGNDTYRYFVTDTLAQSLAKEGVFGIGKQITAQLTQKMGAAAEADAQNKASAAPTSGTPDANKTQKL